MTVVNNEPDTKGWVTHMLKQSTLPTDRASATIIIERLDFMPHDELVALLKITPLTAGEQLLCVTERALASVALTENAVMTIEALQALLVRASHEALPGVSVGRILLNFMRTQPDADLTSFGDYFDIFLENMPASEIKIAAAWHERYLTLARAERILNALADATSSSWYSERTTVKDWASGCERLINLYPHLFDDLYEGRKGAIARLISLALSVLGPDRYQQALRKVKSENEALALAINPQVETINRGELSLHSGSYRVLKRIIKPQELDLTFSTHFLNYLLTTDTTDEVFTAADQILNQIYQTIGSEYYTTLIDDWTGSGEDLILAVKELEDHA